LNWFIQALRHEGIRAALGRAIMAENFDVVVIGGGAVGSACSYFLSKEGHNTALIERGGIASGSSGRCDGNVILADTLPGYDCSLKKMSQDMFPVLAEEIGYDFKWRRKGSVLIIENEIELEVAAEYAEIMANAGLPARVMERNEMREESPYLARDIAGGLEMACDGSLNPMALAQAFAYGAQKKGAAIKTMTAVLGINLNQKKGVESITTDRGTIRTPRIVNAAGCWAPSLGAMVGLNLPIKPRQGQLLVGERTFLPGRRKIQEFGYNMAKFERKDYRRNITPEMEKYGIAFVFEPTEAQNILIGSSRYFTGENVANSRAIIRCLAQRAIRFMPALAEVRMIRTYAGLRPYTPDHFPIVSDTPIKGYYVAAGHEGNGIGLAPVTGKLIAGMISGQPLDIDISPLSFQRFTQSLPSEQLH
jgi:sarcosine oxidase subunit beta